MKVKEEVEKEEERSLGEASLHCTEQGFSTGASSQGSDCTCHCLDDGTHFVLLMERYPPRRTI